MTIGSSFTPTPDAWDLVFATDASDTDPLTLMLVDDNDVALWDGVDAPALATDQPVYREQAVMWQPMLGCGYSRRTPAATGQGSDGQILSLGTSYGRNATFVVPGIVMPAGELTEIDITALLTTGTFRDGIEFGGAPLVAGDFFLTTSGRYVLKVAGGTGAVSRIDFGATATTDSLQTFDGKLYVSNGGAVPIYETTDGVTWTAAAASCKASVMERVNWAPSNAVMGGSGGGTPADHLILVDPNGLGFYHVVSGNDPKVFANWIGNGAGGSIPVGDTNFLIYQIVASPKVVWFGKTNGLHGYTETGRAVNLTPWMERAGGKSNGLFVGFWSDAERAFAFYAHTHGLVVVPLNGTQQESAQFVQFGVGLPNETPIWGRPIGLAPHVDGVFVGYYDGSTSYVMRLMLQQDGAWKWSGSECTIEGEEVVFLKVASSNGVPRLWIGTLENSTTPHLYWQSLPTTGNPWTDYLAGTTHRYAREWDVYVPRDDGASSALKVVRRYDVVARGVGDANSIAVDASADDGAYVEQGLMTSGARSSFIANTYTSGTWLSWRARCFNSNAAPVVLETLQARMSVLPEQSDAWTFRCQLAPGQGLLNESSDMRDPASVRARVRALQRAGPILMRRSPISRQTLTVKIEQGARIQAVKSRKTGELIIVLTLTVSVLQQGGGVYGVGVYGDAEYGDTTI